MQQIRSLPNSRARDALRSLLTDTALRAVLRVLRQTRSDGGEQERAQEASTAHG